MSVYHVVAMAEDRVIGKDNQLPWHYPADLKYFKELTTGNTVIMGRKTYQSIYERLKKPLPNRKNFVLSRNPEEYEELKESHPDLQIFRTVDEALAAVDSEYAFVIGGATIYEQTMDKIQGVYLTHIYEKHEGDAFYPELPEGFVERSKTLLQEEPKIEAVFYERQS